MQLIARRVAFPADLKDISGNNVFCGTVTGRVNSSGGSSIAWGSAGEIRDRIIDFNSDLLDITERLE